MIINIMKKIKQNGEDHVWREGVCGKGYFS